MKELVVISGKGGTGKTSLVGAFASLAQKAVVTDCDVDAADLHLLLQPQIRHRADFLGGSKARINPERCLARGQCAELCRFGAISFDGPGNDRVATTFRIDALACEGCGVCVDYCPHHAIEFEPAFPKSSIRGAPSLSRSTCTTGARRCSIRRRDASYAMRPKLGFSPGCIPTPRF